jgi:adenine-specific DNA-methyltransferase
MNFKENETPAKLRGGYYTPDEIAVFLLRWALARSPKHILEPSCGDGVFFRALAALHPDSVDSVVGFEIEPQEAAKAREAADALHPHSIHTQIHTGDFLSWALRHFSTAPMFDAVVGNPPFIRYQYLDEHLQEVAAKIFSHFHLDFTRHTNAWASFVLASLMLLRPGGRLAMVVPSELLHILYAQSLRGYLAQTCSRILIFDPQELWFKDALQGAVLLLAEKKDAPGAKSWGVSIIPASARSFLDEHPEDYFQRQASYANGETLTGKWMLALLSEHERDILASAKQNSAVRLFHQVADVAVGIVTGANKYFLVADSVVEQYDLHSWAHPMFGRSDHVPGVIYDQSVIQQNRQANIPTNFLWFRNEAIHQLPPSAQAYIRLGEAQKLHTRYKCRIRSPWYSVPSVYATSVGMLKRCHDFPRLIFNKAEAFTTDTAYRVKTRTSDAPSLVYAFVNSLTALSAELEGRHYGGGVLELVPSEIRQLLLPTTQATEAQLYRLDRLIRSGASAEAVLSSQDQALLTPAGFDGDMMEALRHAWLRLKLRRQRQLSQALAVVC